MKIWAAVKRGLVKLGLRKKKPTGPFILKQKKVRAWVAIPKTIIAKNLGDLALLVSALVTSGLWMFTVGAALVGGYAGMAELFLLVVPGILAQALAGALTLTAAGWAVTQFYRAWSNPDDSHETLQKGDE
jgi:hypothetical protein